MDGNTLIEWTGVVTAIVFGATMICQGHFICNQKYGYSRKDFENPEARDRVRRQVELTIKNK